MAKSAERDGEWHLHSTISYAFTMNEKKEMPAIAVFDNNKMERVANMPDQKDASEAWKQDGYIVQNGYTMDEAAIAVFYLPNQQ